MRLGRLHVLVGDHTACDPVELALAALSGGAHVIQVRLKEASDRKAFEVVSRVAQVCRQRSRLCLVDDRVDVALATEADGVHLGSDDLPVAAVRRIVGQDFIIGATARDSSTARRLESQGATYLGVGPCYETKSKPDLPDPIGISGLAAVCNAVSIPVVAIGGITADNVGEVIRAGAHGVAVISAVSEALDPKEATKKLLEAIMAA